MVRETGKGWCTCVVSYLLQKDWVLPAKALLYELSDSYAAIQRSSKRHVDRAIISQLLTEACYREHSLGEAFRWSLLTQADGILAENGGAGGGHGRHWLFGAFGLSEAERGTFDSLAQECLSNAKRSGWEKPAGYAEEALRLAVQRDPKWQSIMQRHVLSEEFHVTPAFLAVLLDELNAATASVDRGKTLENTAFYLFSLMAGCIPQPNMVDVAGVSEHDIVVSNFAPSAGLSESLFGRDFLVECKNWQNPVGAPEVGYFLFRMSLTHCRFGVMLSSNGITSVDGIGEAYAEAMIRRAFHEHGSACVVVTMDDLRHLADGRTATFTGLLIDRLNEFRFGKPKRPA
jgi:hypothetical protein